MVFYKLVSKSKVVYVGLYAFVYLGSIVLAKQVISLFRFQVILIVSVFL